MRWLQLKFLQKYAIKLPEWLLPTVILFGGAIYIFSHIAHEIIWEKEEEADNNILGYLSSNVVNPSLTSFMKAVTWMGSAPVLQAGYGILIIGYVIPKKYKR